MIVTVNFNGIHYQNEVELQIALDFIRYRANRAKNAGQAWTAELVSAETGEIVYHTDSEFSYC